MNKVVLADHHDYRITLHQAKPNQTELLVVTFGGQPSGIADAGFGTDFCLKQGWDTIHVAQRHGTQYQGLPVDAFFDAVSEVCAGRDVICYGSSLGAYAALYFGGCVDARIVAAAPMLPLWPPLGIRTYADLPMTHVALPDAARASRPPVVIYDPLLDRDRLVIDWMVRPAYPAVRLVELPHGGHTVLVTLSQAGLLKPVITALIERDEIVDFDPPGEGTAIWHAEKGRSLVRIDPDKAIAHLEISLSIRPATQPYCVLIGALLRKGDLSVVQDRIHAAKASGEPRLKVVPALRDKLLAAGLDV